MLGTSTSRGTSLLVLTFPSLFFSFFFFFFLSIRFFRAFHLSSTAFEPLGIRNIVLTCITQATIYFTISSRRRREFPSDSPGLSLRLTFLASAHSRFVLSASTPCISQDLSYSSSFQFTFRSSMAAEISQECARRRVFENRKASTTSRRFYQFSHWLCKQTLFYFFFLTIFEPLDLSSSLSRFFLSFLFFRDEER